MSSIGAATRTGSVARSVARAAARPSDLEMTKRVEKVIAKASEELGWKVAERLRRRVRLEAALTGGAARAEKAALELDRIAARLKRSGSARETFRLAAVYRVRGLAQQGGRAPRELLSLIVEALRPAIPFEGATAFLYEKGSSRLAPVVVDGSHVDLIPDIHFDCGAGFSSWVAKTKRPVLLSAFREDPIGIPVERPASFLSVPLLVEDDLVAVLNFAHRRPGTFTATDRDLVLLAGRFVAPALAGTAVVEWPTESAAVARAADSPDSTDDASDDAFTTRTA